MDLSTKYKYKMECSATVKIVVPTDTDTYLAKASLDNLKQYFPAEISPDESPDLLYIALAGFNGGICNKNGDGVTKQTAINIAEKFKNKYIDLEHDRKQIVGNIIGYGFTKHGETESITKEEALAYDGPIDVILSGYVWQMINEELSNEIIESANESSLKYGRISGSWEVLYNDYEICVGSRNIHEGQIISESTEIESYSKYLRSNGGKGIDNKGQEVFKVIKGDCLPVGLGLVGAPAGMVKGVSILEDKPTPEQQEKIAEDLKANKTDVIEIVSEEKQLELAAATNLKTVDENFKVSARDLSEALKRAGQAGEDAKISISELTKSIEEYNKNKEKDKNISLSEKNSVNDNIKKNPDTDLTSKNKIKINKMIKLKFNDSVSDKEVLETAASTDVYEIAKELNKKMTEYSAELDVKAGEVKAAQEASAKLKEDSATLAADLEKVKTELKTLNEVRAQEKVQADFSVRMADLNEKFELDADKSKSIAKQIRGLDDEAFTAWFEDIKTFLVAKKFVPFKKEGEDEDEDESDDSGDDKKEKKEKVKKESKASILEEIAALKPFGEKIVNKVAEGTKSVADLFAEAFADVEKEKSKE